MYTQHLYDSNRFQDAEQKYTENGIFVSDETNEEDTNIFTIVTTNKNKDIFDEYIGKYNTRLEKYKNEYKNFKTYKIEYKKWEEEYEQWEVTHEKWEEEQNSEEQKSEESVKPKEPEEPKEPNKIKEPKKPEKIILNIHSTDMMNMQIPWDRLDSFGYRAYCGRSKNFTDFSIEKQKANNLYHGEISGIDFTKKIKNQKLTNSKKIVLKLIKDKKLFYTIEITTDIKKLKTFYDKTNWNDDLKMQTLYQSYYNIFDKYLTHVNI